MHSGRSLPCSNITCGYEDIREAGDFSLRKWKKHDTRIVEKRIEKFAE